MTQYTALNSPQTIQEEWRDIPGYEGLYQVSDFGNIRSLDRQVITKNGRILNLSGKPLSPRIDAGYYAVFLHKNQKRRNHHIHTLVATTFIGPRPANHDIHHQNENTLDNRRENLTYISVSEHRSQHATGVKHHMAKLCPDEVILIRQMHKTHRMIDIARQLNIPYARIKAVIYRRSWKHVT